MKTLDQSVTEALIIWMNAPVAWKTPEGELKDLVRFWVTMMDGIDQAVFEKAANIAPKHCKFWPTPHDILRIIRENVEVNPAHIPYREPKALPQRRASAAEIREMLQSYKPEVQRMFYRIVFGDQNGLLPGEPRGENVLGEMRMKR